MLAHIRRLLRSDEAISQEVRETVAIILDQYEELLALAHSTVARFTGGS